MKASYSQLTEEEAPRKASGEDEDHSHVSVRHFQKEELQQILDRQNQASTRIEDEGVFEIRDFSSASSFEKLVHLISMATKRWCLALSKGPTTESARLEEEFDNGEFKYNIVFHYAPINIHGGPGMPTSLPASASGSQPPLERLGLHSFPSSSHHVQRWFGVQHFVILSMPLQDYIDINRARTLLSALVLAVKSQSPPRVNSLSCFVPVHAGVRKRYIGEVVQTGWRTVYTSDLTPEVDPSLEHLEGMLTFFCKKLGVDPEEHEQSLTMGVRFTYFVEDFEPLPSQDMKLESAGENENEQGGPAEVLDTIQLHVLWPSFPQGSFVDDASHSELDPRAAPYWKLRITCKKSAELPYLKRLRKLLSFRYEANAVRSAEHSVQPLRPKSTTDSISVVLHELSESIFLPAQDQIDEYLDECFDSPLCVSQDVVNPTSPEFHKNICGAARGTRLVAFAKLASDMQCFKGAVILWCQMLGLMRRQWDAMEDTNVEGSASPPTKRAPGNGLRTEYFSTSNCLLQQKFEMIQRSFETRSRTQFQPATSTSARLNVGRTGGAIVAPELVPPALLTEDMASQQNIHRENMTDPLEMAAFTCGSELHFDVAAFKDANPTADIDEFLAWRSEGEGLDNQVFPREWFEKCWSEAIACPASRQLGVLFDPEREVMMSLHYLENIEGSQLLLQLFRVLLASMLEDISDMEFVAASPHLCTLRDRVVAVASEVFESCASDAAAAVVGEQVQFPPEESLRALMSAFEDLEVAVSLTGSLRHKLRPKTAPSLIEDLVAMREATVTSFDDRQVIMELLERCHECSNKPFLKVPYIDSLPFCKEFIVLLQPDVGGSTTKAIGRNATGCNTQRLYAEIRQRHLRLAIGHSMRLI